MRFIFPSLLGLCALVAARCGTPQPPVTIKGLHLFYEKIENHAANMGLSSRATIDVVIDTYVHIIKSSSEDADIPTSQLSQQFDVLNKSFQSAGFSFRLADTDTAVNSSWRKIESGSKKEYDMKSSLRKGTYQDLNIYLDTIYHPKGTVLGYATFPDKASARTFAVDGVVLDPATLPGGEYKAYSSGITLVHEVGHWLSLFHTFESHGNNTALAGCYGKGDYIKDTPAEGSAAFGCEKGRDTCTGQVQKMNNNSIPGVDPIHNYMDYSDDKCLNHWTKGQITRMQTSYSRTRVKYTQGNGQEIEDTPITSGGPHGG